jgi:Protein of unknown function (DUF1648)
MNRSWKISMAALWLALPLVLARYLSVWDRLPVRMAAHFNAAGQANGWMSRDVSLLFMLGIMLCLLVTFTVILSRIRSPKTESWVLLAAFYVAIGSILWINESLLNYNLIGEPVQVGPVLLVIFLSAFATLAAFLASGRGSSLGTATVMAEEVHAAPQWAFVFLVPFLIMVAGVIAVPKAGVRIALAPGVLLFSLIILGSLSGFQYVFTSSGLEIRILGYRLRSIPREHIKAYALSKWNPLGGYGIRGVGDRRAYVWGNKGVRIETSEGEIFLGHAEPERIIRDLDRMKAV